MSMCAYDGDCDSTFHEFSRGVHVARKTYGCEVCWERINPGERYVRITGKVDGDFGTWRYHPVCLEMRQAVPCGESIRDGVRVALEESGDIVLGDLGEHLSPEARLALAGIIDAEIEYLDFREASRAEATCKESLNVPGGAS
jgi:hypothetical protein